MIQYGILETFKLTCSPLAQQFPEIDSNLSSRHHLFFVISLAPTTLTRFILANYGDEALLQLRLFVQRRKQNEEYPISNNSGHESGSESPFLLGMIIALYIS
jgi:hypothetical protein